MQHVWNPDVRTCMHDNYYIIIILAELQLIGSIQDTLRTYDMDLDDIAFLVGDNCSTNRRTAEITGKKFIGCASHRLHLAVRNASASADFHLKRLDRLVTKLKTHRYAAKLRTKTPLLPIDRQDTRWTSMRACVVRYFEIKQFIDAIVDAELLPFMLGVNSNFVLRSCMDEIFQNAGVVAKMLQDRKAPRNMADARSMFDALIEGNNIFLGSHIDASHPIVRNRCFEDGIVKIINSLENSLTEEESAACACLRRVRDQVAVPDPDLAVVEDHGQANIAANRIDFSAMLKKRKADALDVRGESMYLDLCYIPTGSVSVESMFSISKYVVMNHRQSFRPRTLEMLMYLKLNRRFWDVESVQEALAMGGDLDGDGDDDDHGDQAVLAIADPDDFHEPEYLDDADYDQFDVNVLLGVAPAAAEN